MNSPNAGPELLAQGRHVLDATRIGLARDDRDDLALGRPLRLRQGADRVAQLLERLGVGRDQRQVDELVDGRRRLRQRGHRIEGGQLARGCAAHLPGLPRQRGEAERAGGQLARAAS